MFKTDYIMAGKLGQGVAELYWYFRAPGGTDRARSFNREILRPRQAEFFLTANTWTRVWFWLQDIGQPVSYSACGPPTKTAPRCSFTTESPWSLLQTVSISSGSNTTLRRKMR